MHELGTVFYVIKQVEQLCVENNLSTVGSVTLEIGEVSGIIPKYVQDCWDWAIKDTTYLKNTELKIETLDAVTYCEDCGKTYPTVKYAKTCPYCGSEHTFLLAAAMSIISRKLRQCKLEPSGCLTRHPDGSQNYFPSALPRE